MHPHTRHIAVCTHRYIYPIPIVRLLLIPPNRISPVKVCSLTFIMLQQIHNVFFR